MLGHSGQPSDYKAATSGGYLPQLRQNPKSTFVSNSESCAVTGAAGTTGRMKPIEGGSPHPYRLPAPWPCADFWSATQRARRAEGTLIYRTEDLDPQRCKAEYSQAAMEDLRWIGIDWDEGPEKGGDYGPYVQSLRTDRYREVLEQLKRNAYLPVSMLSEGCHGVCNCPARKRRRTDLRRHLPSSAWSSAAIRPRQWGTGNRSFRLPEIQNIEFYDGGFGSQSSHQFRLWRLRAVVA